MFVEAYNAVATETHEKAGRNLCNLKTLCNFCHCCLFIRNLYSHRCMCTSRPVLPILDMRNPFITHS